MIILGDHTTACEAQRHKPIIAGKGYTLLRVSFCFELQSLSVADVSVVKNDNGCPLPFKLLPTQGKAPVSYNGLFLPCLSAER